MKQHPMVLQGKEDWLFLKSDSNRVLDQISGNYVLGLDFEEKWAALFDYRAQKSKQMGFQYFYGIAPNKECVYARYLPDGLTLSEDRPVMAVLRAATGRVNHRYFLDVLEDGAETEDVFIKGDTHWNHVGALLAFNAMMQGMGLPLIEDGEFIRVEADIDGDLSTKLGSRTPAIILQPAAARHRLIDNNKVNNIGQRRIYEHSDTSLPRAVVFRDSFSSHQLDMLASRFSRTVCLWQPNIDYEIVAQEAPDFVINQQVERFLVECPNDLRGPSHREYEARKLTT